MAWVHAQTAAGNPPKDKDFYNIFKGWDYKRIPLIEPYEAINTNGKLWLINLRTQSIRYQFSAYATNLEVINGNVIIAHASDAPLAGSMNDEVWFVIIPNEKIEKGFKRQADLMAFLNRRKISHLNLTPADQLYEALLQKGFLKWFPSTN